MREEAENPRKLEIVKVNRQISKRLMKAEPMTSKYIIVVHL